jgi:hypothetical protein
VLVIQKHGQGSDAFYMAPHELSEIDAIGIHRVSQLLDEGIEELGPNGGRNLAGYV